MDRQLAAPEGWRVSWEAVSGDSAAGLKFREARRKIILPFFFSLSFNNFYRIIN